MSPARAHSISWSSSIACELSFNHVCSRKKRRKNSLDVLCVAEISELYSKKFTSPFACHIRLCRGGVNVCVVACFGAFLYCWADWGWFRGVSRRVWQNVSLLVAFWVNANSVEPSQIHKHTQKKCVDKSISDKHFCVAFICSTSPLDASRVGLWCVQFVINRFSLIMSEWQQLNNAKNTTTI